MDDWSSGAPTQRGVLHSETWDRGLRINFEAVRRPKPGYLSFGRERAMPMPDS